MHEKKFFFILYVDAVLLHNFERFLGHGPYPWYMNMYLSDNMIF